MGTHWKGKHVELGFQAPSDFRLIGAIQITASIYLSTVVI